MKKVLILLLVFVMPLCSAMAQAEVGVKAFPEKPERYADVVDPANPLKTVYSGAYRVPLAVGEEDRHVLVYLPAEYAQTQGFVMVAPASGVTAEACLTEGGWMDVADAHGLMLMVLESDSEAYDLSADGRDFAYIDAAAALADTRDYWRQPEGRNYIVGYGDGAGLALKFAHAYLPDVWAGVATFGDLTLSASDIQNEGVELPVWMFMSEMDAEAELVELFKRLNGCTDEAFSNAYADAIYFPNQRTNSLLLNDQPMSQVRYTVMPDADALSPERAAAVYEFLSMGTREVGYGAKAMRYTRELSDWGAQMKTMVVDGITRSWVEYVPSRLRETTEGGAPLLVALHGSALNGEYLAERTSLIKLAEDRGFIVVMPTGSISSGIAPVWNLSRSDSEWDDVHFIEALLEDVKGRLSVDPARVYLYGHSMGGMFSQHLVSFLDGTFAAAGGTGCAAPGMVSEQEHVRQTPFFVIMGEYELWDSVVDGEAAQYFIDYFKKYNAVSSDGTSYRDGRFINYVWADDGGAPMVRYTIAEDMPHTATLDGLTLLYDWMSQFSRGEDGSVLYQAG